MKWTLFLMVAVFVQKCNQPTRQIAQPMIQSNFDVQGHRGCRGLLPENSIPAFLKALEIGVNTLEMDVVISADGKVVVSHEPYFSHEICRDPLGRNIEADEELSHNIYQMNLSDIQQFDCGSKPHPRFPGQLKIKTYKPTLDEVFSHVEDWTARSNLKKVNYNIEIKRDPEYDGHFHPAADQFVGLVLEVIQRSNLSNQVTIQAFDVECLEVAHRLAPDLKIAYLVAEGTYQENMARLSFKPDIYSPYFEMVDDDLMKKVRDDKIKIIPWTVNNPEEIASMLKYRVDGMISDYPDRVFSVMQQLSKS